MYFVPALAKVSLIATALESFESFLSSLLGVEGVVVPVVSLSKVSVLVPPHTVHLNSFYLLL